MSGSEPDALPLGDSPMQENYTTTKTKRDDFFRLFSQILVIEIE